MPISVLSTPEGGEEQVNDSPIIAATLLDRLEASGAIPTAEAAHFRSPAALEWAAWSDKELAVRRTVLVLRRGTPCAAAG